MTEETAASAWIYGEHEILLWHMAMVKASSIAREMGFTAAGAFSQETCMALYFFYFFLPYQISGCPNKRRILLHRG
jgi:hypothetical protein